MSEVPHRHGGRPNQSAGHISVHVEGAHPPDTLFLFERHSRRQGGAFAASLLINGGLILLAFAGYRSGVVPQLMDDRPISEIVWLSEPGPGGGGGGGGNEMEEPPAKAELPGKDEITVPVEKPPPVEIPPEVPPPPTSEPTPPTPPPVEQPPIIDPPNPVGGAALCVRRADEAMTTSSLQEVIRAANEYRTVSQRAREVFENFEASLRQMAQANDGAQRAAAFEAFGPSYNAAMQSYFELGEASRKQEQRFELCTEALPDQPGTIQERVP